MAPHRDPISVRTTRLNNLIVAKGIGVTTKATRRSTCNGGAVVSNAVAEFMNREALLDVFCLLYNECDKETLKKRDRNIADFVNKYRTIVEETQHLRVHIDDFTVKSLIGKGYFGDVNVVVERQTGDIYAMKKIKKSNVTTSQVKEERDIMSRHSSQWITNLQYAFQDNDNLYLVMEFLPGGDLLNLMSRFGPFDEDLTKFYLAELILAIHSLHTLGYVHRDIKPENILIDRFGHIKLADFGNAAALDRDGQVISLSPVGTPDYIAPELLQTISTYKLTKSLHDVSCDYWSMGIIGYELICEVTPFHEDNVHETYSKILSHCDDSPIKEIISFPNDINISKNFKNLIESVVTNPKNRLTYVNIIQHPFFSSIKWETLRSQVPPIIPTVKSEDDVSNFEDLSRNKKGRSGTFVKPATLTTMKSNDFSGKDLPFIGYSFVHMEKSSNTDETGFIANDTRLAKLNNKLRELENKLKERMEEVSKLRKELIQNERKTQESNSQSKCLQDAKIELARMKKIITDKTAEVAACKKQMKTLQSTVKVEEEMWVQKEATITELLRLNRHKYEEAKIASEQRYEKLLSEKIDEIGNLSEKLEARETELTAKTEEVRHQQEKMNNYKEMLRQCKEQAQTDKKKFEKYKEELIETYERSLAELRAKLFNEKDSKARLTVQLQDVRSELDETICSSKSTEEAKIATVKSNEEILKRLNTEIEENNKLHMIKSELEHALDVKEKESVELEQEIARLERELQLMECSKQLAETTFDKHGSTYETAQGSLTELHAIEEQLRADLEVAKENENAQRERADKLQNIVEKLESMLEKINEQSSSPTKPYPAPRHTPNSVGDMLEKQNEKLEDKLEAVREKMIVERQAARTAHLALWKVEKQLEDTIAENKRTQRRMELTEERIKKVQNERDEAQRLYKSVQDEIKQREERIQELKDEIAATKRDVLKEHRMWEKSEQERMKNKSEIIEHISNSQKLKEQLKETMNKLDRTQQVNDTQKMEVKRLLSELKVEHQKIATLSDVKSQLQMQLKSLQDNYERLKYACTITDNQLTEVEAMLEAEQSRNKSQTEKIEQLYVNIRQKDDTISSLKKDLHGAQSQNKTSEAQIRTLTAELTECKTNLQEVKNRLTTLHKQLLDQTTNLFQIQERVEILKDENGTLQTLNESNTAEINSLKEENSRVLCDLFYAKEQIQTLQEELRETMINVSELRAEIEELNEILTEKENFYVQREIKSETTISQHKKLIDYLQLKLEDVTGKKKKTFADKFFGSNNTKENIYPGVIESSIVYRTLQQELNREKHRNKILQEQVDKLSYNGSTVKSPLKNTSLNEKTKQFDSVSSIKTISPKKHESKSVSTPKEELKSTNPRTQIVPHTQHAFELALMETNIGGNLCECCKKPLIAAAAYWKCRTCKSEVHRKCRSTFKTACDGISALLANSSENKNVTSKSTATTTAAANNDATENQADTNSLDKYSYEGKLQSDTETQSECGSDVVDSLIFIMDEQYAHKLVEINCAYEAEENQILLLGCKTGLYAYHLQTQRLVHIAGIESVSCIAIAEALSKAILVSGSGDSIFQCDYRQLLTRCQSNATIKSPLEGSVIDLPFANRAQDERWVLVKMSNETENALDTAAIAATSTRIVIMKYDVKLQKFKPVRALDTNTPVISIIFTRHTAIVSSDKFFEIDLISYAAEEFVDLSDASLINTSVCHPVEAIQISQQEFLLCFMEFGVFVDEYGCRSRPYDLLWEYTPTGFMYQEPFLYVAHFQYVQIIRLHRSYSNEVNNIGGKDFKATANGDGDITLPIHKRVHLPFYTPTLLTKSGKRNLYTIALQKENGLQQINHIDALQAFKQKFNESMDTVSSIATGVSLGSLTTLNST